MKRIIALETLVPMHSIIYYLHYIYTCTRWALCKNYIACFCIHFLCACFLLAPVSLVLVHHALEKPKSPTQWVLGVLLGFIVFIYCGFLDEHIVLDAVSWTETARFQKHLFVICELGGVTLIVVHKFLGKLFWYSFYASFAAWWYL